MRLTHLALLGLALQLCVPAVHAQQVQPAAATQQSNADLLIKGNMAGRDSARAVHTSGWFWGGMGAGMLAGILGTAGAWAMAASSDASVPIETRVLLADQPLVYQQGFETGYSRRVRSKREASALKGGVLGTAVTVIAAIAIYNGW